MYLPQVLVFVLVLVLEVQAEYHEINTKLGKIKGVVKTNKLNGEKYYAFKGIPYAKAVNAMKMFRDSEPLEPWGGVLDATKDGPECLGFDMMMKGYGNIDCLYMNVYVPINSANETLATMLFIHGGGFIMGSGDDTFYGPDYFLRENVILVTINYRLAIFGFLNTGTIDAPGNQGLKDQSRAIRFYSDVIAEAVNGDKDRLTIFGESAGAASVCFQLATPWNKGYIARGILQSGSCTDFWAYNRDPKTLLKTTVEIFGLSSTDPATIAKKLSAMSPQHIMAKFTHYFAGFNGGDSDNRIDKFLYIPSRESDIDGLDRFLPETENIHDLIIDYAYNRDVPVMMGVNADEGAWFAVVTLIALNSMVRRNTDNFVAMLPPHVKNDFKDINEFVASSFEYYTGERQASGNERQMTKLLSDLLYFFNYWVWINGHYLNNQDVYAYYFQYRTQNTLQKRVLVIREKTCMHTDELWYMFYMSIIGNNYKDGTDDAIVSNYFTKMWTNFAKYGDPTPEGSGLTKWEKFNENKDVMTISTKLEMVNIENLENNFAERVCRFVPHMIDSIENYCNKFDYCKGKDLPKDF